jgi:hypothetical protein
MEDIPVKLFVALEAPRVASFGVELFIILNIWDEKVSELIHAGITKRLL